MSLSEDKVEMMTNHLKLTLSVGSDKVPNLVVREHMKFIKDTLTHKQNVSLEWGISPERLQTATVTALYEKGDKENIHNYLAVLF
jgi:hypothetical protein